jgi:glutathione peroxidase
LELYDLTFKTPAGIEISMSDYKGKTILIVNTATKCGLTPQFEGLENLHQRYKEEGLVVLGFPCNQFRNQEPESNDSIEEACRINHGVTFQLSEKIDVNGKNTHPIFGHLKNELSNFFGKSIKWNFTKFLISPEGKPYKRYSPTTEPAKIDKDIRKLVKQ